MELTRRRFGALLALAATAVVGGLAWGARAGARACRRALAGRFPGCVRAWNDRRVRQPGRWAG